MTTVAAERECREHRTVALGRGSDLANAILLTMKSSSLTKLSQSISRSAPAFIR